MMGREDMGMEYQELLETAALDVLGVLDAEESARFDSAFACASPEVRSRVRLEQARLADLGELLPDVRPPADLRARVIGAVSAAAVGGSAAVDSDALDDGGPRLASDFEAEIRSLTRSGLGVVGRIGVTPVWRAAAIALGAATIGLASGVFTLTRQMQSISDEIATNGQIDETLRLGGGFARLLLSPDAVHAGFVAEPGMGECQAMVLFDRLSGDATLVYQRLPASTRPYALVVLNEDGSFGETITTLMSRDGRASTDFSLGRDVPERIAIVSAPDASGSRTVYMVARLA